MLRSSQKKCKEPATKVYFYKNIPNIYKSGPFVSAEGCKYQSVHLYPEIKVLMIELNVFYEKILFLTVYCNIPN